MSSTGDTTPAGASQQERQEQELRIEELPPQSTSKEREDALRSGSVRGGAATTSDKDATDVGWGSPARD
jgi:hypothetical protein